MKSIDQSYKELLESIITKGNRKSDRTGTGTISLFGYQLHHNMQDGFPILRTKRVYWKGVVGELLWFLNGNTNIKYLVENNINIWNGDAYKSYTKWYDNYKVESKEDHYELGRLTMEEFTNRILTDDEFAIRFGEMGPVYGYQWRNPDQITNLINELNKNPDSRRLLVDSWNPEQLASMVLPPCHYSFQCNTRLLKNGDRELSLLFNMRSWDVFLGGPFNLASYGLLLLILCKITNMVPGKLVASSADTHLYQNHLKAVEEFLETDESDQIPFITFSDSVDFKNGIDGFLKTCQISDIILNNYQPTKVIKAPLSN
jgi:thymidylate synthase